MPPFQYENYRSPYVGTISELLGEPGRIRAQQALTVGNANAQAAQASGQAWGNAISNIGQSVAAIPAQRQQQRMMDLREREMTAQAQERGQQRVDLVKLDELLSMPGGRDKILEATPGHLRPALMKHYEEADKFGAEARSAAEAAAKARAEHFGYLGAQIKQADYNPTVALTAIHQARDTYADDPQMLKQIDQMRMGVIEQPESIRQIADAAILGSSHKDMLKTERPLEHDPTKDLVSPTGQVIRAAVPKPEKPPTVNPGPIHDTANGLVRVNPDNSVTPLGVKGYHAPASNSDVGGAGGGLTPDAVEYTATQYRVLGAQGIPTRLGEAEKTKIINAAAAQTKALGQSPATAVQRQAAFKSDAASLTQMRKMGSSAEAFETKALSQADIVMDLSSKVGRTSSPLLNRAILEGKKELLGDTNTQLLYNALTTFTSEYAKIMEGSTGSVAASSDSARKASERLVKAGLAPETLKATMELMKKEMRFTIQGYDATIDHISTRMGGTAPTPTAAPATAPPTRIRYDMNGKPLA